MDTMRDEKNDKYAVTVFFFSKGTNLCEKRKESVHMSIETGKQ